MSNIRAAWSGSLIALCCLWFASAVHAQTGPQLDLEKLRGKVVVVDFWASWCVPCRHSLPWLNGLQARHARDGLVVIGVNVDHEHAQAEKFLREVPVQFDVIYDSAGVLATRYEVPGMPTSYLFDRNGKLVAKHVGFKDAARTEREAELEQLLAAPARQANSR